MSSDAPAPVAGDHRSLAAELAPVLRKACDDRLGKITWFKADWQRGGAATGRASLALDDGSTATVIVKLPLGRRELMWMQRLQSQNGSLPVIPRLYASGTELNGYDLAWGVMEHFSFGPLGLEWHDDHIPRIADATAQFHLAASAYEVSQPPRVEPWNDLLKDSLESVRTNHLANQKEWTASIKKLRSTIRTIDEEWAARDVKQWLHGDLHLANAMSRDGMDHGTVSLIDLAEMHAGNWIEDAVYLERQLWMRPERTKIAKPVKAIAQARKALGLPVEENYPRLAMIRRALLAGTAPRYIKSEGHPAHLEACRKWLDIALSDLT